MSIARTRFMAVALALIGSGVAISLLHAQQNGNPAWNVGDVFVAIGSGKYEVRDKNNNYQVKQTLQSSVTPRKDVGGCWFDSQFNLYTADVENTTVVKYNLANGHQQSVFANTDLQAPDGGSNSIVMAVNGDVFVGHAAGSPVQPELLRYRSDGVFLDSDTPAVENGGIDWMDLATDQRTMFYTSRGRLVKRFNVETDAQLGNFTLPGSGTAYAIRLLGPSFNGADGLLVADTANIKRLNGAGAVVATYDHTASGNNAEDDWRTLNLDPDGIHFWAGGFTSGRLYRFVIASGTPTTPATPNLGPIQPSSGNNKAMGICVMGEPQTQVFPLQLSTSAGPTVLRDLTAKFGDPASKGINTAFYSYSEWRLRIDVKGNQNIIAAVSFTPQTTDLICTSTDPNDFDCRFTQTPAQCVPFFQDPSAPDGTGTLDQYRCGFFRVKDMPVCSQSNQGACPFDELFVGGTGPGSDDILSEILVDLANPPDANFSAASYGPAPKGNPRLMRDPDSVPGNQFVFDATTAVIDWPAFGTGTPNDYSPVQRFPTALGGGCAVFISPSPGEGKNSGSNLKIVIEVRTLQNGQCTGPGIPGASSGTNSISVAVAGGPPNSPFLTQLPIIYCGTPGNSLGCFEPVNGQPGRYQSTFDLTNPPFFPSTQFPYFLAVTSINVASNDPLAQNPGVFAPIGTNFFVCPTGNCGSQ